MAETKKNEACFIDWLPEEFLHTYTRKDDGEEFQKFDLPRGLTVNGQKLDGCSFFINDYQRIYQQKTPAGEPVQGKWLLRVPSDDWEINLQRSIKQDDGTYKQEKVSVRAGDLRDAFDNARAEYKASQAAQKKEQTQEQSHDQVQEQTQEKKQSKARQFFRV